MNFRNFLRKLFGASENEEENEEIDDGSYAVGVQWPSQGYPQENEAVTVELSEQIEAWKKLYFDINDRIATQAEVRDFELAARFARSEADELQDAMAYMADAICHNSTDGEEEVPDWVINFGKALLFEYVTGSLRLIQGVIQSTEDEPEE